MAKLTWRKEFNNYEINFKFLCRYNNGFIIEFDSYDMTSSIDGVFELMNTKDNEKVSKMSFLELTKYLFAKIPELHSVEFVSSNSKSEYFIDDIKNN